MPSLIMWILLNDPWPPNKKSQFGFPMKNEFKFFKVYIEKLCKEWEVLPKFNRPRATLINFFLVLKINHDN